MNILSVNLHTGMWRTLFSVDTPYHGMFSKPTICGDLAAIKISDRIIIVNWKTQSCMLLCTSLDPDYPEVCLFVLSSDSLSHILYDLVYRV